MKPPMQNKEELQQWNRLGTMSRKTTPHRAQSGVGVAGDGGGFNQFYSRETSPLILMPLQITNMRLFFTGGPVCTGILYPCMKLHSEIHIIIITVMKEIKWFNCDLKPEHKKTTNRLTTGPTTDIDSPGPTI